MFTITLTSYGQSQVSSQVSIDGFMLLYDYIADVSSVTDTTGYTIQLDDETRGNYKNSVGSLVIKDLSNLEYQAKTILLYKVAGGYKRILGGYSQNSPIVQKNTDILNVCIAFDFSAFTNGFSFSYTQAGISTASHNSDGILHIENPSITSDDSYSVYSKIQTDSLATQSTKNAHYLVKGTQSSSTQTWTGNLNIDALYEGLVINYLLPYTGTSSNYSTLTLTLADGTSAGPYYIYYRGNTRVTTQFPAGTLIQLTYLENVPIGSSTITGWFCNAFYYYDSNNYDMVRLNNRVTADTNGIYGYQIILRTEEGKYTSICRSCTTDTNKLPTSDEFYLDSILYYAYNTTITSGNVTSTECIYNTRNINVQYNFNVASLTANQPVYLKVLYDESENKFYFDSDVDWWSQTLPNSYDGYIYVYLGIMYNITTLTLDSNHPMYMYVDDYYYSGIKEIDPGYFLTDYVTLSTDQGIAADKYLISGKKFYFSPLKQSYAGSNDLNLVSGNINFSSANYTNKTSSLYASVLQDNSLEINGNLLPTPTSGTTNSIYTLGSSSAKFASAYISTVYGDLAGNADSATYTPRIKYNSSATKSFYVNSSSDLLCQGNIRPHTSYAGAIDLGSSTYKWNNVYATTFNGNATSATKLNSSVNLDGKSFDGSASITHYVRCSSAATDVSKVVDCPGFELVDGARLSVYFVNTNSATNPTLKIRTSTSPETFLPEKGISIYGTNGMNFQSYNTWRGGSIIGLVYDATTEYWIWEGYMRYTYRSDSATYDTAGQSLLSTYIKTVDLVNYAGTVIDSGSSSSGSDCTWGAGAITASKYPTHIRFTKGNSSTRIYISIAALVASSLIGFSRSSSSGSLSPYGAIGSVAILMVQRSSNSTTIDRGTIIDSASTLVARGLVANSTSGDLSWTSGASGTVSGTWVALNYTGTSSGGYNYCMVLAIRIL